jgi:hypothetical protein
MMGRLERGRKRILEVVPTEGSDLFGRAGARRRGPIVRTPKCALPSRSAIEAAN